MNWVMEYLMNILAAISQLFNALIGGDPNLTVSARCYLSREHWFWGALRKLLNWVFWREEDHCYKSWRADVAFCDTVSEIK